MYYHDRNNAANPTAANVVTNIAVNNTSIRSIIYNGSSPMLFSSFNPGNINNSCMFYYQGKNNIANPATANASARSII